MPSPARPSSSPPPRAVALTVCAVVAAIVLGLVIAVVAGCSGSHTTGTAADPARAVPASAALYAGADVRPKGEKRTAALDAGRALTHQADPYLRLLALLQTPGSPAPDFSRDVAPWLGNRAGVFLTSLRSSGSLLALIQRGLFGQPSPAGAFPFGASGAQGAIVLDTRELKKARAFLDAAAARAGAVARSYRGIAYRLSGGDVAFALVRRFAVIGSDAGIRAVIDTTLGGPSLARAPGYSSLLGFAPAKAIAHLYSNTSGAPAGPPSGLAGLLALFAGARQVNVSLVPSASSLALDVDTLTAGSPSTQPLPSFASESARALGELPGHESDLHRVRGEHRREVGHVVGRLAVLRAGEGRRSVVGERRRTRPRHPQRAGSHELNSLRAPQRCLEQLHPAALHGLAQREHRVEVSGEDTAPGEVAIGALDQLALLYDVLQPVRQPGRRG